jgi:phage host-nuclease inhibitor protein Gam
METLQNVVNKILPSVIQSDKGYLVDGNYGSIAVDVAITDTGLECQCFEAQVSNIECEHVRIVRDYLTNNPIPNDKPAITQADADYYLSKVSELDEVLAANTESATKQIDRIKLWLEVEMDKLVRRKDYYTLALDNYMHLNDFSTKRLVNGTIKVRSQQPEIKVTDESKVLTDERFVRIVPEKRAVDKAALRKHCTQTGEELPGIEIILKPHKFSYKLSGSA